MSNKTLIRICETHGHSYDVLKQQKCQGCLDEMAEAELKAHFNKGAQDAARKTKRKTR